MRITLLVGLALGTALLGLLLLWLVALAMGHGNSLVTREDLIGQVGRLQLPCTTQQRGLVRLTVRGSLMDVPAYSCADPLHKGLAVMVVEQRGGDVGVTPFSKARSTRPSPFHASHG